LGLTIFGFPSIKMISNNDKFYFKAFGLTIQSPIPVRGLIPIAFVENSDINIIFEKIEPYPELKLTKVNRKGLTATFGMFNENTNDAYMVWENQINFRLIEGKTMIVDTTETDLDFLSLFIVSEPLGILLFQRGDILLHASAIQLPNGEGIVFMGEPGAGKSTTAAAFVKVGCKIISDDLVAIRLIDNKPFLIPSFPQIKLWKESVEGLGYDYDEVEQIVEGANKFAYENKDGFLNLPIVFSKIYILGEKENTVINKIYTPLELLKYHPLPHQIFEISQSIKDYFEKSVTIGLNIEIEKKRKINKFIDLNKFTKQFLKLIWNFVKVLIIDFYRRLIFESVKVKIPNS
jgi:hypothetical protein